MTWIHTSRATLCVLAVHTGCTGHAGYEFEASIPSDGQFTWSLVREPRRGGQVSSLVRGPDGALWLAGDGGIDRFVGGAWERETLAPDGPALEWVRRVAFTVEGEAWAAGDRLQTKIGNTWLVRGPMTTEPGGPTAYDVAASPDQPATVYVVEGIGSQWGTSATLWELHPADARDLLYFPTTTRPIALTGGRVAAPTMGVHVADQWTPGLGGAVYIEGAEFAWDATPDGRAWTWVPGFIPETGMPTLDLARAEAPGDFAAIGRVTIDDVAPNSGPLTTTGPRIEGDQSLFGVGSYLDLSAVTADGEGAWFGIHFDDVYGPEWARIARFDGQFTLYDDLLPNGRIVGLVPEGDGIYAAMRDGAVWLGTP